MPQNEGDTERPLDELARQITQAAVRLAAATAAWLRLIAEFDERGGWHGVGIKSCAHWLAWQCGLGPGAAREHVRVARTVQRLPLIGAAFAEGRLSYAKVRALTRVADPDCEAELLELAEELTASQVERVVRQWRRADRPDAESIQLEQDFQSWWDDDGMLVLRVRMPAEQGATLLTAVNSLAERAARRERAVLKKRGEATGEKGRDEDDDVRLARERTTARRLAAMAQLAAAAVDADRRAGDPPRREVVLHVDSAVIDADAAAGRAYLDGGPALHPSQARRMLCEANVVVMLEKDREILAVGRTKRRATRAQRRALLRRDGGCARPGCPENRIERLHAHHMRHWLHGGRTDLANMVLLCDADHGLVHYLDLVVFRRGRELVVTTPDGRRVWGRADAAFADGLAGFARVPGPDDGAAIEEPVMADEPVVRDESFIGVEPIDCQVARRPSSRRRSARRGERPGAPPSVAQRAHSPRRATRSRHPVRSAAAPSISRLLFPAGEPALAGEMKVNGERMNTAWVVSVLMGNRDLTRRLAAESGAQLSE